MSDEDTSREDAHGSFIGNYYREMPDDSESATTNAGIVTNIRSSAYRSVQVTIRNKTNFDLEFVRGDCHDGQWTTPPSHNIASMRGITFGTIARHAFGKTSGAVIFKARRNVESPEQFAFRWENGALIGNNEFSRRSDSQEYVILQNVREGHHSEVTFVVKNALRPNIPEKWELDAIKAKTYFSLQELRLIWRTFNEISDGYKEINKTAFVRAFPEFDNELILRSLFSAFADFSGKGDTIDFNEFSSVLSIMTRGNPREQTELAFNICDVDKSGRLERAEAEIVARHFSNILNGLGYDAEMYGAPEEVLDNLFQAQHSDLRFFSKPIGDKGHKVHTLKEGMKMAGAVGAKFLRDFTTTPNQSSAKSFPHHHNDDPPVPTLGRGPNTNSPMPPKTPKMGSTQYPPSDIPHGSGSGSHGRKPQHEDSGLLSRTPRMNDYGAVNTPRAPKTPNIVKPKPNFRASMSMSMSGPRSTGYGHMNKHKEGSAANKNLKILQTKVEEDSGSTAWSIQSWCQRAGVGRCR